MSANEKILKACWVKCLERRNQMCGINGFSWKDASLIEKMNQCIKHRGPDDQSTYIDDNVSLGHRRLSIIDLSPAGKQPMSNEDMSIWIIFNGEIYNFAEIKSDLLEKGHSFRSSTDTEIIIHAYEEWGSKCVERFNGMWAFAIYDPKRDLLFLSRDRFGVKPLYYHSEGLKFIFSSEIKAILEHPIDRIPNDRIIYEYLALGVLDHSRDTFFKGISRVMPGENLIYHLSDGSIEASRWYDLKCRTEKINFTSMEEITDRVSDLFEDSIKYRLIADVPVGSCLSGGLDSSAIVYAMRDIEKSGQIKAFSMVFPGEQVDESKYIDEVVRETNVESYKVTPTIEELRDDLQDFIWTQEEPFRTVSTYGHYRVMKLAHENGMKVLLDGQGADETLAGYVIYFKYYIFESLLNLRLREALRAAEIKHGIEDLILLPAVVALSCFNAGNKIINRMMARRHRYLKDFYKGEASSLIKGRGLNLNSALYSDLITFSIPQLLRYEDKNSMRWSIESRVPFLDYRLVELAASMPSGFKIHQGVTKYIFREAVRGLVSDKILDRRDKIGFKAPEEKWLRAPIFIELMNKIIGSHQFKSRPYWKPEEVKEMLNMHASGERDLSEDLWKIISVELWMRVFIDRQGML